MLHVKLIVKVKEMDARKITFPDETFDMVFEKGKMLVTYHVVQQL
jgi:hypothetical protein